MAMIDWDKLRIFHAVAQAGSFTHAGDSLRLSQSAISRQISALEESLNAPLFHRHARGLVLTEQGELLFRTVQDMNAKLNLTETLISESRQKPEGPLRVTATTGIGASWLTPRIREFVEHYPDIEMTLIVSDAELDLTMREADIAIQLAEPTQPDLIRRSLMTVHSHIYGSSDYLKRNGIPQKQSDLHKHRLVCFTDSPPPTFSTVNWMLNLPTEDEEPFKPVFRVNSIYGVFRAVLSGVGLGSLPDYMVENQPSLVRVLPELEGPELVAYFVYPEALRESARVAAFRDFLLEKIAQTRF
jgi:DNA-binding transcriptional LysR family regulator